MEQKDKKFPIGLIVKEGNADFCIAKLSFKVKEFSKYLDENSSNGWLNIDILKSKNNKIYSVLNDWIPSNSIQQNAKKIDSVINDEENNLPF